jgi:hypothetical protein
MKRIYESELSVQIAVETCGRSLDRHHSRRYTLVNNRITYLRGRVRSEIQFPTGGDPVQCGRLVFVLKR